MATNSRAERRDQARPAASREAKPLPVGIARVQRSLAVMAAVIFVLTVIAIIILAILTPHYTLKTFDSDPLRAFIAVFPTVGIAATLLLLVALFTVTALRRSRQQR